MSGLYFRGWFWNHHKPRSCRSTSGSIALHFPPISRSSCSLLPPGSLEGCQLHPRCPLQPAHREHRFLLSRSRSWLPFCPLASSSLMSSSCLTSPLLWPLYVTTSNSIRSSAQESSTSLASSEFVLSEVSCLLSPSAPPIFPYLS